MTLRTVQISENGPLVQGDAEPALCACGSSTSLCWQHQSGQCNCTTHRATVRTGPSTTATGRLIPSERTSE